MSAIEQPYPGPRSFRLDEGAIFFGRDRETANLASLVAAHAVVVLYAGSGAGKSSLLNAGLVAALHAKGMEVIPEGRVRRTAHEAVDPDSGSRYVRNAILNWSEGLHRSELATANDLAEFVGMVDEGDKPLVLILDQLEELFTLYPDKWPDREVFFEEIQAALDEYPSLRVVLALREDHVAKLDSYAHLVDGGLQDRFRLERLTEAAALAAVVEPVHRHTQRRFATDVAEGLVERLLTMRVDSPTGTTTAKGQYVEPVQLQIVCQNMWDKLGDGETRISSADIARFAQVHKVLAGFYRTAVEAVVAATDIDEAELRDWVEESLITPAGTRGLVFGAEEGIPRQALPILRERRIVRPEERSGATWYELTHDLFIAPIREDNRSWFDQYIDFALIDDDLVAAADQRIVAARSALWEGKADDRVRAATGLVEILRWPAIPDSLRSAASELLGELATDEDEEVKRVALRAQRLAEGDSLSVGDVWVAERRRTQEGLFDSKTFQLSVVLLAVFCVVSAYATAMLFDWLADRGEQVLPFPGRSWVPAVVGAVWASTYMAVFVDAYATAGGDGRTDQKYHFQLLLAPWVPLTEGFATEKPAAWPFNYLIPWGVAFGAGMLLNDWFSWAFSVGFFVVFVPMYGFAVAWYREAVVTWYPRIGRAEFWSEGSLG